MKSTIRQLEDRELTLAHRLRAAGVDVPSFARGVTTIESRKAIVTEALVASGIGESLSSMAGPTGRELTFNEYYEMTYGEAPPQVTTDTKLRITSGHDEP